MRRNPDGRANAPLVLDGDELNVLSVTLDGKDVSLADCARPIA